MIDGGWCACSSGRSDDSSGLFLTSGALDLRAKYIATSLHRYDSKSSDFFPGCNYTHSCFYLCSIKYAVTLGRGGCYGLVRCYATQAVRMRVRK